jgi:prefoldin subunit 5
MSFNQPPLSEAVSASFLELTAAAQTLNAVSDALGKTISEIDESLKKLNLGVTAWVTVQSWGGESAEYPEYDAEEIGYAKVNGKWAIALRTRSGNAKYPEREERIEEWVFNEAARTLRLKAIGKVPALISQLSQEANQLAKELQEKLAAAQAVAAAVQEAARKPKLTSASGRTTPLPMNTQASSLIAPPAVGSEAKR